MCIRDSILTGAAAGAVIGGTMGFASPAVVTGYTASNAVGLGTLGAASNMAGNVAGQLIDNGGNFNKIDTTDVAVAGVTGFASGVLAPVGATTLVGSVALGGVANTCLLYTSRCV